MHKVFLYAETAFHHEGDLNYLLKLIDAAADVGADGIKFQVLLTLEDLIATTNPAYEKLKDYVFTHEQWQTIFSYAVAKKLAIIAMPLDPGSFTLIDEFKSNVKYVELHSVSFNDFQVKEKIKASGIELILGVGGRTPAEIDEAIQYFGKQLTVLMTGFQSFPSSIQDIRLRKIQELVHKYPAMSIGYGDHSGYNDSWAIHSNELAYALGATIFEKHLTIDEGTPRVDYESAISPQKFKLIRDRLDEVYNILYAYSDSSEMTEAEGRYRNRQKMTVARKDLKEGTILSANDLSLKMVGSFDGYPRIDELIGKKLSKAIALDNIIRTEDVIH